MPGKLEDSAQSESPDRPRPSEDDEEDQRRRWESLARFWRSQTAKLSRRTVFASAGICIFLGIGLALYASTLVTTARARSGEEFSKDTMASRLTTIAAEALLSTGITTILVTAALHNRIETTQAISDAFEHHYLPALRETLCDQFARHSGPAAASVPDPVLDQLCQSVRALTQDIGTHVRTFRQGEIYKNSAELLKGLQKGTIRILMSAEEELGSAGNDWLDALATWLDDDPISRSLHRVIATNGSAEEVSAVAATWLEPFRGKSADQWLYVDLEFSLSVMLMDERYAVFGFPHRHETNDHRTAFQYAAAIENADLVASLARWFENRFEQHPLGKPIMRNGAVTQEPLL